MKFKPLPGTFGFGIVWDGFTQSLIISVLFACIKLQWPRVGACKTPECGHDHRCHRARRDRGMITWRCVANDCECQHYQPEVADAPMVSFRGMLEAAGTVMVVLFGIVFFLLMFYRTMGEPLK